MHVGVCLLKHLCVGKNGHPKDTREFNNCLICVVV